MDASDNRINDVLPYKSKHAAYFTMLASLQNFQFSLQVRGRSRIDEVFIYPGSEPDGYALLNGKVSYSFTPTFSTYLAIKNLTNVLYEEIERYRMEGRSFTAGIYLNL